MTGGARKDAVFAQIVLTAGTATAVGLIDAALVVSGIAGARGAFQFVPARIWLAGPLVWNMMAALTLAATFSVSRRRGGLFACALLWGGLVAIRLRSHAVLLAIGLALVAVLVPVVGRWLLRGLEQPPRAAAVAGVLGMLPVCVIIAAAGTATPAARPAQGNANGPNVILIFLDTVRYDAIFDFNGRVHQDLPTLARLARQSVTFTRAYATSPWTLPSHFSAVTGLPAHELGLSFDRQVYDRPDRTLAEHFRARGYRTAAVVSNSFLNRGSGFARGFDSFEQAQAALDICRTAPGLLAEMHWPWFAAAVCNWTAGEVTRRARALLDDESGPIFLTLNYMDAHEPYYVERSCGEEQGYRAAVRCLDDRLAAIADWRSQRRPTVLAIVADHGEQFGEHGLARHGNSVYAQVLHVPLMIRPGDSSEPRVETTPVSIAALPLLLENVNSRPANEAVVSVLYPPAASNLPAEWSAIDSSWHLIVREGGPDALFYWPTDPDEERNVITTAPSDPAIDRLRTSVDAIRRVPRPSLHRFRSLGYVH